MGRGRLMVIAGAEVQKRGVSPVLDVRRREFITLLGGAAAAWPLAARGQQPERVRRVGALMGFAESDPEGQIFIAAFREGLHNLGWTEGRNIRFDTRWAALDPESVTAIRERTRRTAARSHSLARHTYDSRAAATNTHHPDHFRLGFGPSR
jgi:hypothetical protein